MSHLINKNDLLEALIDDVKGSLIRAKNSRRTSQNDANEAPGAMVSRYDSAKEESQYLAGAQQLRETTIEQGMSSLVMFQRAISTIPTNKAVIGAILTLKSDSKEFSVFLAPYGGGTVVRISEIDVLVITKESPFGRALWGLEEGDIASMKTGQRIQEFEILTIY